MSNCKCGRSSNKKTGKKEKKKKNNNATWGIAPQEMLT